MPAFGDEVARALESGLHGVPVVEEDEGRGREVLLDARAVRGDGPAEVDRRLLMAGGADAPCRVEPGPRARPTRALIGPVGAVTGGRGRMAGGRAGMVRSRGGVPLGGERTRGKDEGGGEHGAAHRWTPVGCETSSDESRRDTAGLEDGITS